MWREGTGYEHFQDSDHWIREDAVGLSTVKQCPVNLVGLPWRTLSMLGRKTEKRRGWKQTIPKQRRQQGG
jgi:hypothetical protein